MGRYLAIGFGNLFLLVINIPFLLIILSIMLLLSVAIIKNRRKK